MSQMEDYSESSSDGLQTVGSSQDTFGSSSTATASSGSAASQSSDSIWRWDDIFTLPRLGQRFASISSDTSTNSSLIDSSSVTTTDTEGNSSSGETSTVSASTAANSDTHSISSQENPGQLSPVASSSGTKAKNLLPAQTESNAPPTDSPKVGQSTRGSNLSNARIGTKHHIVIDESLVLPKAYINKARPRPPPDSLKRSLSGEHAQPVGGEGDRSSGGKDSQEHQQENSSASKRCKRSTGTERSVEKEKRRGRPRKQAIKSQKQSKVEAGTQVQQETFEQVNSSATGHGQVQEEQGQDQEEIRSPHQRQDSEQVQKQVEQGTHQPFGQAQEVEVEPIQEK